MAAGFRPAGATGSADLGVRTKQWARTAEDVLWRRYELGLQMTPARRERSRAG